MKWTLINPAGTNDPDTGDIYSGLDRFGRVKDHRWLDGAGADLDRIQYGYDRAGNRIWRRNVVAAALGKEFDELYGYDGIHRLKHMARGTLNGGRTALSSETFAQCWTLDSTGNWQGFREDDTGNGTWNLIQQRSANAVNEISNIAETAGPSWVTPAYSRAGNMTTLPQPGDPTQSYTATYDAWNRLVKIADGADTVAEYQYDGARRRIVQKSYTSGVLDETRHLYYTEPVSWQVLEERLGTSPDLAAAERQFVWGLRYIDDLVLRDWVTDDNGTLNERLYACQDANWNVTAITNDVGVAQERYAYAAYGMPLILSSSFVPQTAAFDWETLYCGYRYETATSVCHVRHRTYHPRLGVWLQRDPAELIDGPHLYEYCVSMPFVKTDPIGLGCHIHYKCEVVPGQCTDSICVYKCTETRRDLVQGGEVDCGEEPDFKGPNVPTKPNIVFLSRPRGEDGNCPSPPKHSYLFRNVKDPNFKDGRDCSQAKCLAGCKAGDDVSGICDPIKNPLAEAACDAAFSVGGSVCQSFCTSWCTKQ